MEIINALCQTTNKIIQGEVLQLSNTKNMRIDEKKYKKIIYYKTAKLFETSCDIACVMTKYKDTLYHKHLKIYQVKSVRSVGNCCWMFYRKRRFRGNPFFLMAGNFKIHNVQKFFSSMMVRSVRRHDCGDSV